MRPAEPLTTMATSAERDNLHFRAAGDLRRPRPRPNGSKGIFTPVGVNDSSAAAVGGVILLGADNATRWGGGGVALRPPGVRDGVGVAARLSCGTPRG